MKKLEGDLLIFAEDNYFDVIIHGCNCFCDMGAGIALSIKEKYPEAYEVDSKTVEGDRSKLGDYTLCQTDKFTIVNAYTQYHWDISLGINVDYDAIRSVMKKIKKDFPNKRIGYPLIGAGIAGGDWEIISKIIDEELGDADHTAVIYKP